MYTIADLFDLSKTAAAPLFQGKTYPWEVLGDIADFIKALGCDTHGLPVVSICADSLDLFGFEQGILVPGIHFDSLNPEISGNYFQKGREWERVSNVEFYDYSDNGGINQICGLRTHGNRARRQPQKGLKIYARQEYGNKHFHHQFFESDWRKDLAAFVRRDRCHPSKTTFAAKRPSTAASRQARQGLSCCISMANIGASISFRKSWTSGILKTISALIQPNATSLATGSVRPNTAGRSTIMESTSSLKT